MVEFFSASCIVTAVLCAVFGCFVFYIGPKQKIHLVWFLFSIVEALWAFGLGKLVLAPSFDAASFWLIHIHYPGAIFIPALFFHFVCLLLDLKVTVLRTLLIYIPATFFLSMNYIGLLAGVGKVPPFAFYTVPREFYGLFTIYFFIQVMLGLILLIMHYRSAAGIHKNQIKAMIVTTAIAFTGGSSAFLPVFGVKIIPYGVSFYFIHIFVMSYAIVKHQFLNIEVIIKRTLVFAGLVGAVVTVVSFVAFLSQEVLAQFITIPRWTANIFSAMIIAAVYGRVRDWLVNTTDRFLFQKKIDYRQLLRKFTDEVMEIVNLNELLETTVDTLTDTVKLESANLLLFNKNTRQYEMAAARGQIELHAPIDEDTVFITFLKETHEPIGLDGDLGKVNYPVTVYERLELLNARLCLPLHLHDDLIGVLCLGAKKSDEEFTAEDIDVLLPVARTLSIAIANAQLFDELLKTQVEAAQKEKLAVIGTLSAGINHEICNPLGIIKAQTEAFLLDVEDGLLDSQSSEDLLKRTTSILENALKQIDRATAITQKLSNFAKPIKETAFEAVVLANEIDEVLGLVGHELELSKIELRTEVQLDMPEIFVDRRQLQEVLFNLVRNAAQAIDPPGAVTVRAYTSQGNVRIEIQDTGHGIPKDKINKIWDPFFTTKDPGKGTGLGLFIVRQIVERNKGRISVESKEGEGTTFFLEFPIYKEQPASV